MCNYTLNGLYRRVLFAVGNLVAVPVSGKKLYLCRVEKGPEEFEGWLKYVFIKCKENSLFYC